MSKQDSKKIIIQGVTEGGEQFRPSNWAERMSGKLSTFKKRRISYSPLLRPMMHGGNKCVMLDEKLKESNPELYQSILEFARINKLQICEPETDGEDE